MLHLTLIVCSWHHVLASSVRPIVVNISQERIEGISLKVGTNVLLDSRRIRLDFVVTSQNLLMLHKCLTG